MDLTFQNKYGTELCRTPTHIYLLPHPALRPHIAHYTYCPPTRRFAPGGDPLYDFTSSGQMNCPCGKVLPRQGKTLVRGSAASPLCGGPCDRREAPGGDLPCDFASTGQSDRPSPLLTLLPDASGCLVFTFTPRGLDARVYGPTTRTVDVVKDFGFGPPRFFVEFRPGGLFALTGVPQWELSDRVLPLSDLSPVLSDRAAGAYGRAADVDEFAHLVEQILLRLDRNPAPIAPLLRAAGPDRDAQVSGYSPRHLSRLFREGAGMGYKSYLRVLRVNAAARRLRSGPSGLTLTALAQELGYFDQAHFIHDFKATCGVTPGAYRTRLGDFYNEPLKF